MPCRLHNLQKRTKTSSPTLAYTRGITLLHNYGSVLINPFLALPVSLEAGMHQATLSFVLLLQVFAGQIRQVARQLAQTARGSTSGRSGRGMSGH